VSWLGKGELVTGEDSIEEAAVISGSAKAVFMAAV